MHFWFRIDGGFAAVAVGLRVLGLSMAVGLILGLFMVMVAGFVDGGFSKLLVFVVVFWVTALSFCVCSIGVVQYCGCLYGLSYSNVKRKKV